VFATRSLMQCRPEYVWPRLRTHVQCQERNKGVRVVLHALYVVHNMYSNLCVHVPYSERNNCT
jgi:hypothetical protein